jgi:hypothetical protein
MCFVLMFGDFFDCFVLLLKDDDKVILDLLFTYFFMYSSCVTVPILSVLSFHHYISSLEQNTTCSMSFHKCLLLNKLSSIQI